MYKTSTNKKESKPGAIKNKKIDKSTIVSFGVNFCAVFSLIYTVALLLIANMAGSNSPAVASLSASLPNKCSCDNSSNTISPESNVLFPVPSDELGEASERVVMDDGGYVQKRLEVSLSGPRTIIVENKGVNTHSFVIDGLKIDSGLIIPGEEKTIVLENLPEVTQNYTYYSNVSGDNKESFNGVIVVTE